MATTAVDTRFPMQVWGDLYMIPLILQPTAADYVTGGYTLTPGTGGVSLKAIYGADLYAGGNGYAVQWNVATGKLQILSAPATEVANGTDLSGTTFYLQLLGI